MNKKGIVIAIVFCIAMICVAALVFVNRKNNNTDTSNVVVDSVSTKEAVESTEKELQAVPATGPVAEVSKDASAVGQKESGTKADKPTSGNETGEGKTGGEPAAEKAAPGMEPDTQGEVSLGDIEYNNIVLPRETDIPEDWDWEQSRPQNTTPVQPPKNEETGTNEESTAEPSGEEPSSTEISSEEQSSEEGSTEETEPETETTTLSPEEQASIVESALAPIELPSISLP